MPLIRARHKQGFVLSEGRILLMLPAIQNKAIASVTALARVYDVPRERRTYEAHHTRT
jgi:hypothetical protein